MHFSLIVATYGRVEPLDQLFASLAAQRHRDFTIILVDQNPPNTLEPVLARWRDRLPITHIHTSITGVSRARNLGLRQPLGEVVAFPDDDCFFDPWSLEHTAEAFIQDPACDVILGRLHPPEAAAGMSKGTAGQLRPGRDSRYWVFRDAGTVVQMYRKRAVNQVGMFDETLGPGAGTPWIGGEDTDFLVRSVDVGCKVRRCDGVRIYHPVVDPTAPGLPGKSFGYGRGRMRLLRKHRFPWWFAAANLIHPLACIPVEPWAMRRFRWHLARGRLYEWLHPAQVVSES